MTIDLQFVSPDALHHGAPPAYWLGSIATDSLSATQSREAHGQAPLLNMQMQVLQGEPFVTRIVTDQQVSVQTFDTETSTLSLSQCADHLFGVITIDGHTPMQSASEQAYALLLNTLQNAPQHHLLRLWNFIPHINDTDDRTGQERYRLFNAGRHQALQDHRYLDTHDTPSACALGTHEGDFTVAFLSSTTQGTAIENPRQVSAYQYPKDYGDKPPLFARATSYANRVGRPLLFISGTASIVGHESLHPDDVVAQTLETLANLRAVLLQAQTQGSGVPFDLAALHGHVFVRYPEHVRLIAPLLAQHGMQHMTYLHADVCRNDLLMEIEAFV